MKKLNRESKMVREAHPNPLLMQLANVSFTKYPKWQILHQKKKKTQIFYPSFIPFVLYFELFPQLKEDFSGRKKKILFRPPLSQVVPN